jgi:hypothetical protein
MQRALVHQRGALHATATFGVSAAAAAKCGKLHGVKVTICVEVDSAEEVALVERWFDQWRARLTHCSENSGCGCCVNIWDVDAPEEAVAALPPNVLASTAWSEPRA